MQNKDAEVFLQNVDIPSKLVCCMTVFCLPVVFSMQGYLHPCTEFFWCKCDVKEVQDSSTLTKVQSRSIQEILECCFAKYINYIKYIK